MEGRSRVSRKQRDWGSQAWAEEEKLCRLQGPHSQADSKAVWGSGDAHVQSTATRRPRPQAFGARGAPYLTFGFASKPSPSAPWARGLLSAFWEQGSPDLPACGPRVAGLACLYGPPSSTRHSRPSRGAKPREADDRRPPQERLRQAGSRGAERSRQGAPREVPVTQAMTTRARRAPARAVSSFPLWC